MIIKKNLKKLRVIAIVGPTSSGKSDYAVKLAKKIAGEIVSADSRQVYKELNLSSGKITVKEMCGIPHHMLDVISLKKNFSVSDYQKLAYQKIDDIIGRGKIPIICGGTGFYIQSIVDGIILPEVKENKSLRKKLEKKSLSELQNKLKKLDSTRFRTIDRQNKVRLIRAIEIAEQIGKVPKIKKSPKYIVEQIGLFCDSEILKNKIKNRLHDRIKKGMVNEIKKIHQSGISWKKLENIGLECRFISLYLQNKISHEQMIFELENKIYQYAKRQMTWFKKDKRILWVENK